jgi:hypothetical protein
MALLNKDNMEKVLSQNWSSFLDTNKVLVEILKSLRDGPLPTLAIDKPPVQNGICLSVSRTEVSQHGILLWIEFKVPDKSKLSVGTLELHLSHDGDILQSDCIGHSINLN